MRVVYLDNHILVVDKPAGLLTQETSQNRDSLENQAKAFLKEKFKKKGKVFLGVVHRLDKDVSGLVLFARTSKALSRLNQSMREKQVKKIYLAHVEGKMEKKSGVMEDELAHGAFCAKKKEGGKKAILYYELIEYKEGVSLVRIILKTGRYHQIRAQFALRGHPILGDKKYGSKLPWRGIALHHQELHFVHPTLKEWISVSS